MAAFSYELPPFPSANKPAVQEPSLIVSLNPKIPRNIPIYLPSKKIGPYWLHISTLRDEFKYSPTYIKNIDVIKRFYSGWKKIRGDGNCYYRSVISVYFQKIFHFNQPESRIFEFLTQIHQVKLDYGHKFYYEFEEVNRIVTDLYYKKINSTFKEKVEIFFKVLEMLQDENFDLLLIKLARTLTDYLLYSPASAYIRDFITTDEVDSFHYRIKEMGQEAEGIELSLLPKALNIQVTQVNIFGDTILYTNYPEETGFNEKIKINIISKSKGHYDSLYSVQDMEDEDYSMKTGSYMVDI